MARGACENCGNPVGVAAVTFSQGGRDVTADLCPNCKDELLGRRRTRRAPAHRKHRSAGLARVREAVRDGGPIAYVGVALFLLGLVLVPVLTLVSLLTR